MSIYSIILLSGYLLSEYISRECDRTPQDQSLSYGLEIRKINVKTRSAGGGAVKSSKSIFSIYTYMSVYYLLIV